MKLFPKLFKLASGRFLRKGQKADIFFVKMLQEWSLIHLLRLFPLKPLKLGLHIPHISRHCALLCSYWDDPLSPIYNMQWFF